MCLAVNLARNAGYAVLPCRADKSPACPHGFRDATRDPAAILQLWHRYPGELIGIATGGASGTWVVDVDVKHRDAMPRQMRPLVQLMPSPSR